MIAKVTAPDLAQDVAGAEALISRHQEYHAEIDSRVDAFAKFYATGKQLINQVCTQLLLDSDKERQNYHKLPESFITNVTDMANVNDR